MARMRSLKPEFWLDRKLARSLTRDERMLYLGLWNQADEWGRANGDARVIKGQVFPFDDDLSLDDIEQMLKSLERVGVVQVYEADGDPYLFLPKLAKHQRLEPHKVPSRHPEPPEQGTDQPVRADPEPDPNPSEPRADESAPHPDDAQTSPRPVRAKHVAGSMEHGAGVRGADESAPPESEEPPTPLEQLTEPPLCHRHQSRDRDNVPACRACMRLRQQWQAAVTEAGKPPPRPDWCGHCDERTRLIEIDDRTTARCLACHPFSAQKVAS